MPVRPELRLGELALVLPPIPKPMAKYRTALIVADFLYLSGHAPLRPDGSLIKGRVGDDLTVEQGKEAARAVGTAILSSARAALGSLDRVERLIKTLGFVNCIDGFSEHPQVMNGFSELMAEVFGDERGVGVRSAVGANALPANIAVEVECVFQITS